MPRTHGTLDRTPTDSFMPQSLPAILLGVLSSTGLGVLAWLGLSLLVVDGRGAPGGGLQVSAACVGIALAAIALLLPLLERLRPRDAGLPSAPTGPWAMRSPVLSVLALLPALAALYLLLHGSTSAFAGGALRVSGVALAIASLGAVAARSRLYADVPAVAAWREPVALPIALVVTLACGLSVLLLLLAARTGVDANRARALLAGVGMAGALCLPALWLHWRALDPPVDRVRDDSAAGRQRLPWRLACIVGFAGVPLVAWSCSVLLPIRTGWPWLLLATAGVLVAAAIERGLFLAEATRAVRRT